MRSGRRGGDGQDRGGKGRPCRCGRTCLRCSGARAPGAGYTSPHYLGFEVDHIVALADDGTTEERNLQLLCSYCNRVKGTKGKDGYRLKMAELRADNVATGVMAKLTGKRLVPYHCGKM